MPPNKERKSEIPESWLKAARMGWSFEAWQEARNYQPPGAHSDTAGAGEAHEWIDARNEFVESGFYCRKCSAVCHDPSEFSMNCSPQPHQTEGLDSRVERMKLAAKAEGDPTHFDRAVLTELVRLLREDRRYLLTELDKAREQEDQITKVWKLAEEDTANLRQQLQAAKERIEELEAKLRPRKVERVPFEYDPD